jgi:hypothetical protein
MIANILFGHLIEALSSPSEHLFVATFALEIVPTRDN